MQLRHELKHEISMSDMIAIRQRMRAIAKSDPHAIDGKYFIRSLYFDTPEDRALIEKQSGISQRQKFRIRYYNYDTSIINLEKKSSLNGLGTKYSARLSADQVQKIISGDIEFMRDDENPLIQELYCKMIYQRLRPKTIVDYEREPYIYAPGNVRVTFDYDIRTGLTGTDFLNPDCITVEAVRDKTIILEVKWDDFLPSIIRDCVNVRGRHVTSFSKYAQCRLYG